MSREIKFRAWITNSSIPFMAVQGELDIETLGVFFPSLLRTRTRKNNAIYRIERPKRK